MAWCTLIFIIGGSRKKKVGPQCRVGAREMPFFLKSHEKISLVVASSTGLQVFTARQVEIIEIIES